jgi:hypothetical protein
MPRRRSGLQPLHIAGAAAFLAVIAGGWWFLGRDKGDQLQGNTFSVEQYGLNKLVRGNTYVLTGTVLRQLRFGDSSERLFSIEVKDEGSREAEPVSVLVPSEFSSLNIQVGQEFQMTVIVDKDTSLRARDIKKT